MDARVLSFGFENKEALAQFKNWIAKLNPVDKNTVMQYRGKSEKERTKESCDDFFKCCENLGFENLEFLKKYMDFTASFAK